MPLLLLRGGKGSPSKTEASSLQHQLISVLRINSVLMGMLGGVCAALFYIFDAFFHSSPIYSMRDSMAQHVHCLPSFPLFHALRCVINKQQAFHTKEKQ